MILSIIAIAVVLFLAVGLYNAASLKTIHIVKTVTIKAPKAQVFAMVKYLDNFPKWSPFLAEDPAQKHWVTGTDGTVGAQYHWDGNKGKDLGFQQIEKIEELNHVGMRCHIQKPFVASPTFDYYFTETADGIEVKQDFKVTSGLPDTFFMWLFGAKKDMEKMNEKGLAMLKQSVETQKQPL